MCNGVSPAPFVIVAPALYFIKIMDASWKKKSFYVNNTCNKCRFNLAALGDDMLLRTGFTRKRQWVFRSMTLICN